MRCSLRGAAQRHSSGCPSRSLNSVRESVMPKAPPLRLGVNVDHVATLAQRAGRRAARSGARGAGRDRGRRRRHHRASARGPPPHPRRRHGAAEGRNLKAAEFRDGGDRGHAADCARDQAARGVPGARAARRTHHRGRPRRGRTAQRAGAVHRAAERCRRAGVAVHRRRSAADRDGGKAARAGDRDPHRRLVRRRGRRPCGEGRGGMAADRRRR